jgi:broad specificity phosphatase PhoE
MIRKRYILKIYDTELGGEYEFDSDSFRIESEKGLTYQKVDEENIELKHNFQERHKIYIWSGFENWEDFVTEVKND